MTDLEVERYLSLYFQELGIYILFFMLEDNEPQIHYRTESWDQGAVYIARYPDVGYDFNTNGRPVFDDVAVNQLMIGLLRQEEVIV